MLKEQASVNEVEGVIFKRQFGAVRFHELNIGLTAVDL